jgi:hypothetical protein
MTELVTLVMDSDPAIVSNSLGLLSLVYLMNTRLDLLSPRLSYRINVT